MRVAEVGNMSEEKGPGGEVAVEKIKKTRRRKWWCKHHRWSR